MVYDDEVLEQTTKWNPLDHAPRLQGTRLEVASPA